MRTKLIILTVIVTALVSLFIVGGEGNPLATLGKSTGYILPPISIELPTTGPDGNNWAKEGDFLVIGKAGEEIRVAVEQTFLAGGVAWQVRELGERVVVLIPSEEKSDPMQPFRNKLD